jgi:hypothetical protein
VAKVKSPLMSQEAHGALGGIEFRTSTYGNIVGRRSITPNRRTPSQLSSRALLVAASKAWEAKSDTIKAMWDDCAGPLETGRTAYIASYIRLIPTNTAPYPLPALSVPISDISNFHVTSGLLNMGLATVQWDCPAPNSNLVIFRGIGTWSYRSSPQHSRMPIIGWSRDYAGWGSITLPAGCPIAHVRMEQIGEFRGEILTVNTCRSLVEWLEL